MCPAAWYGSHAVLAPSYHGPPSFGLRVTFSRTMPNRWIHARVQRSDSEHSYRDAKTLHQSPVQYHSEASILSPYAVSFLKPSRRQGMNNMRTNPVTKDCRSIRNTSQCWGLCPIYRMKGVSASLQTLQSFEVRLLTSTNE
jgi:hypothetical protein